MWIAVLDDLPAAGKAAAACLERGLGVEVVTAVSIDGLLEVVGRRGPPALFVLDYQLAAGATGFDALAILRGQGFDAPAVVWTSSPPAEVLEEARQLGFGEVDILSKHPIQGLARWAERRLQGARP